MLKKLGSKLKEQKGFTLVELLAVIVILGIIAAIAIPAIGNVINNSKEKAAVQEGLQIINAAKYYVSDVNPDAAELALLGTKATGLDKAKLAPYLDRVEDDGFTVTIDSTTTAGKLTYLIVDHESNVVVNGSVDDKDVEIAEQELVDWE
ncbi:prepilin-type N-terminal cleavage/methylation domain-containing protein [Neobacillus niacini]|uniref:prepilin-type N-terminal cleavage/methylation domain-containing protein n=1 Tax=Neobacillus niacini TaxID=86668 RepID=UPI002FFEBBA1